MKQLLKKITTAEGKVRVKFFWLASIIISVVLTILLNIILNVIL